jgi:putative oxidoreductase
MTGGMEARSVHALAALRIVAALLFLAHGLTKLVGFPVGAAPGEQPLMTLLGFAGVIEVITGLLLILGVFTRPAALIASGEMAVAYWFYHAPRSFFPAINGGDAAILFCFIFLYIFAAGPGSLSLDGLLYGSSRLRRLSKGSWAIESSNRSQAR